MDTVATPSSHTVNSPEDLKRTFRETIAIGIATLLIALAAIAGFWLAAAHGVRENYRQYLTSVAVSAAQLVDPVLHDKIRDPAQLNGPEYRHAVEPLRRMRATVPDVRYIYTMVRDGDQFRFVLDAADPGDHDGDGVEDQSGVWEAYREREPAMLAAMGTANRPGVPAATEHPYSDKWGAFMTGWAPLKDQSGRQFGALGVDVKADVYLARLDAVRRWALLGSLPALALTALFTIVFYRVRLRYLAATQGVRRTAAALAAEQERLRSVVEGTHVGIWEVNVKDQKQDCEIVLDDRCAGMLGHTALELNPLTLLRLAERIVHPEDLPAARAAFDAAFAVGDKLLEIDLRMQHATGHWVWVEMRGKVIARDSNGHARRVVGTQMDVSARKSIELALAVSESHFRSLFELSPVGICLMDMHTGRFLQVNDALVASTGYSRDELLKLTDHDVTPARWHDFERRQLAVLATGNHFGTYEKEYRRKDGSFYSVLISGTRVNGAAGEDLLWTIVQDISERKAMESELTDAARRDKLTGLVNRTVFLEQLQHSVDRVRAGRQERLAVLFLDFDRFKLINDAMGHAAGDELLRGIAARLERSIRVEAREGDAVAANVIARFGGDEFLVLLNDLDSCEAAEQVAARLLEALSQKYSVMGREVYSTASIGIVTSDQCIESAEAILRNADVAMYEAKRSGRACAVVFTETMRTRLTRSMTIEACLRNALGTSELTLVYQPIVELVSGRVTSVEALVRWNHPELGLLSPSEFIPIAEDSGLIVPLGHWVLQEACAALTRWRARFPQHAPETMSINLSRAELAQGERLLTRVQEVLQSSGLPPTCLQLEVTEREVMRDAESTLSLMHALRAMGVRLAMDDFGTGTSSLGCLRDYPFDVIKIDRSFIQDVPAGADVMAVIHATINLVENLGKRSVAEGVENASQVAVLQSLGCHYAQGFFFSRPVSEGALLPIIANSTISDAAVVNLLTHETAIESPPAAEGTEALVQAR